MAVCDGRNVVVEGDEAVAVDAGLSTGTLARLELGKSDPPWSTTHAVAAALGLTVSELASTVESHERER